jgi:hypothetical protein
VTRRQDEDSVQLMTWLEIKLLLMQFLLK